MTVVYRVNRPTGASYVDSTMLHPGKHLRLHHAAAQDRRREAATYRLGKELRMIRREERQLASRSVVRRVSNWVLRWRTRPAGEVAATRSGADGVDVAQRVEPGKLRPPLASLAIGSGSAG
jgi:hypothetical protein